MSLRDYQKKRDFKKTAEPSGRADEGIRSSQSIFVVQKHDASHLHYDLRLEVNGVLKSWAVPKGPSLDPSQKRLAMMVEDHPYSYRNFEGQIPEGSYGAGEVIVWDYGTFTVGEKDKKERDKYILAGLKEGKITFELHGQKLQGSFALVKMHGTDEKAWLLIKHHDQFINDKDDFSTASVLSDRQLTRDEVAESPSHKSKKTATKTATPSTKLPKFFTPMLATLVDEPFTKKGWVYENKLDGYRTLAFVDRGDVTLYSRNQLLLNKKFPAIVKTLQSLPFQAVLDGEVVGVNAEDEVDFQILQNSGKHQDQLQYAVFDLPFLNGKDISQLPLTDRKKLLKKAVEGLSNVTFVPEFDNGKKLFEQAKKKRFEGIVAKKADSPYQPNIRGQDWLKIKITKQQEAIICGYTAPKGSRKHFGSLLLGVYQNNILHYIGHTGSGFPAQELTKLKEKLDKLETTHSPFAEPPLSGEVTWVKPELVCEVKYSQWTRDNILRQAIFLRLREDKDAKSVSLEVEQDTSKALEHKKVAKRSDTVKLTHPDKVYWPKLGLTKKDLLNYYERIAPVILPYLRHRPESLNRFPNGVNEPNFFQKDITFDVPDFVRLVSIDSEDVGKTNYLVCDNPETLLYMANLGCIEINPWNSRVESLDCPDYFVIDLDPVDVPFSAVVQTSLEVKKVLDLAEMKSYCKTSGKKGMHIFIPLHGQYETEVAADFSKLVATLVHQRLPESTSLERSPSLRQKKVYLDFLQNRKGQTIASPYSLRPTEDATVSAPLDWKEVTEKLSPKDYTITTMIKRIEKLGDVWEGMLSQRNNLKAALKKLQTAAKA